jgi:hypothetical protein
MILIMAVTFAITVLATVILLNTLHAPADVNTRTQASSLDDIERTQTRVAADMERLFLVHTSMNRTGEALPYADNSGPDDRFDNVVRNYSDLNAALTGAESGAVVSVSYVEDRSQRGILVHQNDNESFTRGGPSASGDWTVLQGAEGLPRLNMNVTSHDSTDTFKVVVGGTSRLNFNGTGVEVNGEYCGLGYPIQVEATAGVGTVSNQTEVCGTFDLELPDSDFDLEFQNGDTVTGNYTISGTDTDSAISSDLESNTEDWQQVRNGVIVNPAFRMEYTDSTITHTANFSLYNETSP